MDPSWELDKKALLQSSFATPQSINQPISVPIHSKHSSWPPLDPLQSSMATPKSSTDHLCSNDRSYTGKEPSTMSSMTGGSAGQKRLPGQTLLFPDQQVSSLSGQPTSFTPGHRSSSSFEQLPVKQAEQEHRSRLQQASGRAITFFLWIVPEVIWADIRRDTRYLSNETGYLKK